MNGNTFNFHGPVQGRIVTIGSTLTNVIQTAGALEDVELDDRRQLAQLIEQLKEDLTETPEQQIAQSETLTALTKDTVEKVEQKQPKALINMNLKNLTEVGNLFMDTLPKVPNTIDAIVKIMERLN